MTASGTSRPSSRGGRSWAVFSRVQHKSTIFRSDLIHLRWISQLLLNASHPASRKHLHLKPHTNSLHPRRSVFKVQKRQVPPHGQVDHIECKSQGSFAMCQAAQPILPLRRICASTNRRCTKAFGTRATPRDVKLSFRRRET
jgi:hypothetical protein